MKTTNLYKFLRFVGQQYSEQLVRELKHQMFNDTSEFVFGEIISSEDFDDEIDIEDMNVYTEDMVYLLRTTQNIYGSQHTFWFSVERNPSI